MKCNERQNKWFLEFIPFIIIPEYNQLARIFFGWSTQTPRKVKAKKKKINKKGKEKKSSFTLTLEPTFEGLLVGLVMHPKRVELPHLLWQKKSISTQHNIIFWLFVLIFYARTFYEYSWSVPYIRMYKPVFLPSLFTVDQTVTTKENLDSAGFYRFIQGSFAIRQRKNFNTV